MTENGSPVSGYVLEILDVKQEKWSTIEDNVTSTKYTTTDAKAGMEYQFRVSARNKEGIISKPSEPSNILKPYDKPDAPGTPIGEIIDNAKIKITWSPPMNDNGAPISGYIVEKFYVNMFKQGKWSTIKDKVTPTEYTIDDVKTETVYQFRVSAQNIGGQSSPSEPSNTVTLYDKPDSPENLTAANIGNATIMITWSPPRKKSGSAVIEYMLEKLDVKEGKWSTIKDNVTSTEYNTPDVKPGSEYKFRVTARNRESVSTPSEPSNAIIPYDLIIMQDILRESIDILCDYLNPEDVLPGMKAKGAITDTEVKQIRDQNTDPRRVEKLLDILRHKPSLLRYNTFMEKLNAKRPDLHQKVKELEDMKHNA
ncbi:immunoglobulin-like and fibronectin type III domain-containing protein 1 [Amphiura filiformis]|uniref:immunoglobulin-like and fibronectin type III domain-containing protein 1 n=1 Tax=Amphiura filiformis TaxID=82378 RepID=UPI003B21A949